MASLATFEFHKSNYRVTLTNSDDYKLPYVKDKTHLNMMLTVF